MEGVATVVVGTGATGVGALAAAATAEGELVAAATAEVWAVVMMEGEATEMRDWSVQRPCARHVQLELHSRPVGCMHNSEHPAIAALMNQCRTINQMSDTLATPHLHR